MLNKTSIIKEYLDQYWLIIFLLRKNFILKYKSNNITKYNNNVELKICLIFGNYRSI